MVTLFRIPGIRELWAKSYQGVTSEDIPWTPLNKPLTQCRVGLVTTGGLHLRRDLPFDMNDPDGDPTFRKVPCDAEASELVITHDYYDHRDADHDLPRSPMNLLAMRVAEQAIADGTRVLDLGISSVDGRADAGLVQFKRSVGASEGLRLDLVRRA